MKRILITIDTEMDADCHWKKRKPVGYSSILEGIPIIYRPIWDKYNIYPIYFVSPEVLGNEECCKILREEIDKGAIIGAHLHPEYIEPEKEEIGKIEIEKFPCYGYSYEVEKNKIINLKALIKNKLGVDPVWYRAARFGADYDTIKILEETGFLYDSSFTPHIDWSEKGGPNHKEVGIEHYKIKGSNIMEFPVTILGKRFGIMGKLLPEKWIFYKWLRPTHMTYIEERNLISQMAKKNIQNLVMMFHSMEVMINKTPYVRTKWMQDYYIWRLEKTIEYAKKRGYESYKLEDKNNGCRLETTNI